jgi:hypothetical protein
MVAFDAVHLDGVLRMCTAQGWPTFAADPDRALRALLAPGSTYPALPPGDGLTPP